MVLSLVMLTFQALTARKKCPEVATFGVFSYPSGRSPFPAPALYMPHAICLVCLSALLGFTMGLDGSIFVLKNGLTPRNM